MQHVNRNMCQRESTVPELSRVTVANARSKSSIQQREDGILLDKKMTSPRESRRVQVNFQERPLC